MTWFFRKRRFKRRSSYILSITLIFVFAPILIWNYISEPANKPIKRLVLPPGQSPPPKKPGSPCNGLRASTQSNISISHVESHVKHALEELTLVSLYLDLGYLIKGEGKGKDRLVYTRGDYVRWFLRLTRVLNPLVFYTEVPALRDLLVRERTVLEPLDNFELNALFENLTTYDQLEYYLLTRTRLGLRREREAAARRVDLRDRTRAFLVERSSLPSFSRFLPLIREILAGPSYPRYNPNTVVPEYGATMHAKFDVMKLAVRANYFGSKYFAWVDIGLFRELAVAGVSGGAAGRAKPVAHFGLMLPPQFDERRIAFGQVFEPDFNRTPEQIVAFNDVWVCGCTFIAERSVMLRFTNQYAKAVEAMLAEGLSDTDQQVFYSMYSSSGRSWLLPRESPVELQAIVRDTKHCSMSEWFFLAYLCKEQWELSRVT